MELVLLTVPGCPNAAAFGERLAVALASYPGAVVHRRVVVGEQEAAAAGMHGSPTLLVDGTDPFCRTDQPASMSRRLYLDAHGRTAGAPSVDEARRFQPIHGGSGGDLAAVSLR